MPLPNEKIAEILTLAEVLGANIPSAKSVNDVYDRHLSQLTASVVSDPVAEREQERMIAQQLETYKQKRR